MAINTLEQCSIEYVESCITKVRALASEVNPSFWQYTLGVLNSAEIIASKRKWIPEEIQKRYQEALKQIKDLRDKLAQH